MGKPGKPIAVLVSEKKSHLTRAQKATREKAEKSLLTGAPMKERAEVKSNPTAHKEYMRVIKLLKSIGKNDDIYGGVVNRYCIIYAECLDFEERRNSVSHDLDNLVADRVRLVDEGEMPLEKWYSLKAKLVSQFSSLDRQLQAKRKMLLDLEKECAMTIASALRTIPKQPEKKTDPLLEVLHGAKQSV
ncbi:MAG: P27 family phage terminase small subunit [Defluviitaleaceae bacterium]|nr:P27 family phage terminase small subunit [Defluviitaleaceae bacterium]MCL2263787.1 P27 family phage terminase small subunit [Defluviitaleaceae bacterium]